MFTKNSPIPNNAAVLYDSKIAGELHAYDQANPRLWEECRIPGHASRAYSEMIWLQKALKQPQLCDRWRFFDEDMPGAIVSLNFEMGKNPDAIPDGARLVYCHGFPKNHHLPASCKLREHWT